MKYDIIPLLDKSLAFYVIDNYYWVMIVEDNSPSFFLLTNQYDAFVVAKREKKYRSYLLIDGKLCLLNELETYDFKFHFTLIDEHVKRLKMFFMRKINKSKEPRANQLKYLKEIGCISEPLDEKEARLFISALLFKENWDKNILPNLENSFDNTNFFENIKEEPL